MIPSLNVNTFTTTLVESVGVVLSNYEDTRSDSSKLAGRSLRGLTMDCSNSPNDPEGMVERIKDSLSFLLGELNPSNIMLDVSYVDSTPGFFDIVITGSIEKNGERATLDKAMQVRSE